jgi:hypothetical protein
MRAQVTLADELKQILKRHEIEAEVDPAALAAVMRPLRALAEGYGDDEGKGLPRVDPDTLSRAVSAARGGIAQVLVLYSEVATANDVEALAAADAALARMLPAVVAPRGARPARPWLNFVVASLAEYWTGALGQPFKPGRFLPLETAPAPRVKGEDGRFRRVHAGERAPQSAAAKFVCAALARISPDAPAADIHKAMKVARKQLR